MEATKLPTLPWRVVKTFLICCLPDNGVLCKCELISRGYFRAGRGTRDVCNREQLHGYNISQAGNQINNEEQQHDFEVAKNNTAKDRK